jgi:hypothetical protein
MIGGKYYIPLVTLIDEVMLRGKPLIPKPSSRGSDGC